MNRIARYILSLVLLTSLSTGCAKDPAHRFYSLVCLNRTPTNAKIQIKNKFESGVHDDQSARFDAANDPGSPGHCIFWVHEQTYIAEITHAVEGTVLARFEIPINGRTDDASWGDYTADAIFVFGDGGGIQSRAEPVDQYGQKPIGRLIERDRTGQQLSTPIYPLHDPNEN